VTIISRRTCFFAVCQYLSTRNLGLRAGHETSRRLPGSRYGIGPDFVYFPGEQRLGQQSSSLHYLINGLSRSENVVASTLVAFQATPCCRDMVESMKMATQRVLRDRIGPIILRHFWRRTKVCNFSKRLIEPTPLPWPSPSPRMHRTPI
jgi:hypothetical protein